MVEHPLVQDLVATMQKRPFLRMLREWRDETYSKIERELLTEVIEAVMSGDFDG